jgi:NADPH:quinone reductase-like Zn-dependent oxidoreductase
MTASVAFYQKGDLGAGLSAPWEEGGKGKYSGKPILILGGASSVGQYGKHLPHNEMVSYFRLHYPAIQLAKLSGFSPIITTASLHNEAHLKSLGATHVIDRKNPLAAAVHEITSTPFEVVFDTISSAETQTSAYEVLGASGCLPITSMLQIPEDKLTANKKVISVFGNGHVPQNRSFAKGLYSVLTQWVEEGLIVVSSRCYCCLTPTDTYYLHNSRTESRKFRKDYVESLKGYRG